MASNLEINTDIIEVYSLKQGSVIVDYGITPSPEEFSSLKDKQERLYLNGQMDLGYSVLQFKSKTGTDDQKPPPKKELVGGEQQAGSAKPLDLLTDDTAPILQMNSLSKEP